jgi:NAD-dependent dihydropyrimidine dehydrogenase PreA subunit
VLTIDDAECVGCRLCAHVCPVDGCITFESVEREVAASAHGCAV